jgi:hypothetical protein
MLDHWQLTLPTGVNQCSWQVDVLPKSALGCQVAAEPLDYLQATLFGAFSNQDGEVDLSREAKRSMGTLSQGLLKIAGSQSVDPVGELPSVVLAGCAEVLVDGLLVESVGAGEPLGHLKSIASEAADQKGPMLNRSKIDPALLRETEEPLDQV